MATYHDSSDEDACLLEIEGEQQPKTEQFVNDVEGMKEKLQEMIRTDESSFPQSLAITSIDQIVVEDVDDDLQRELGFYNQAGWASKEAIQHFEKESIKWRRPEDYYAEMVKSDQHMAKIKDQLMYEQKRIALSERRRKEREAKKFAKQVQAAKTQEKQSLKKQKTAQIKSLRSQRKRRGFGEEFDWDTAINETSEKKPKRGAPNRVAKSGKRMYKDAKYGKSGGYGKARDQKRNTAESSGDMGMFRGGKKQKKRPGKERRIAERSGKKSRL